MKRSAIAGESVNFFNAKKLDRIGLAVFFYEKCFSVRSLNFSLIPGDRKIKRK